MQEYERYKQAAEQLDALPRLGRDVHEVVTDTPYLKVEKVYPVVSQDDLLFALRDVMARAAMFSRHHIQREPLSVRERMSQILGALRDQSYQDFTSLFTVEEGRRGVVVALLAILELMRESLIELIQAQPYGAIHVKATSA